MIVMMMMMKLRLVCSQRYACRPNYGREKADEQDTAAQDISLSFLRSTQLVQRQLAVGPVASESICLCNLGQQWQSEGFD